MIRVVVPDEQAIGAERVTFACLPLADCLLALHLLANDAHTHPTIGSNRLRALTLRLDVERLRAIQMAFNGAFPMGTLAFDALWTLPDAADPAALIAALRALPDVAVVAHALTCGGNLRLDAPRSPGVLRSLIDDPVWAAEYVQRFLFPVPPDPSRVVDVVTHPARARQQLADLLAGLFDDCFVSMLPELRIAERAAEIRMRALFRDDPAGFVAAHLPDAAWQTRDRPRLLCWPSAFLGSGWATLSTNHSPDTPPDRPVYPVAYGADIAPPPQTNVPNEPGVIVPEVAPPETYQDVYRLLADPVRWTLIQLLVAAPRYGQELAELLGLSIATVSHHLNVLKRLDLVDIRRDEHRLYYHLRTDRLRALLAGAEQHLLAR